MRCHCYIIHYKNKFVLVDTSMKFERNKLKSELSKYGITQINAVFITHNHADHIANAQWISVEYNCPIYISALSVDDTKAGISSLPNATMKTAKVVCFLANKMQNIYNFCNYPPCDTVYPLTAEAINQYLGEKVYLLQTPGHSADSVSFIINDEIALVGDAMVNRFGRVFPPFANDVELVKDSWGRLLESGVTLFLPAHGKGVTDKKIRENL